MPESENRVITQPRPLAEQTEAEIDAEFSSAFEWKAEQVCQQAIISAYDPLRKIQKLKISTN